MGYKSIGTDDKKNKIYSDGEFAYYAKTPQQIFQEKATAYANSKPVTIVNKKNPNRSKTIPVLAVGSKGYKQAVNKFVPEGFTAYTKTDYDIKKVNSKGFDEKIAYNELRANQATEKSRTDSLIERQRSEAQQKLFQNQLDVKEELAKRLNTPIQQENIVQQIPYTSSGGYSEVFQKIAGRGNQEGGKRKANVDTSSSSPLTAPITPITTSTIAPETPMQKQTISAINQNVGGTNNQQNFTMPNTTGLTFGGS